MLERVNLPRDYQSQTVSPEFSESMKLWRLRSHDVMRDKLHEAERVLCGTDPVDGLVAVVLLILC